MILYTEEPKDTTRKLLELSNEFGKVAGYKINTQKSVSFLFLPSFSFFKNLFNEYIFLYQVLVVAYGILVPWPGIEPRHPALGAWSLKPMGHQGSPPLLLYEHKSLDLGPTQILDDLIFTWSHPQRPYFQIRSHSQVLGLKLEHNLFQGTQFHTQHMERNEGIREISKQEKS